MCGIVGKVSFGSIEGYDLDKVKVMAEAIKHRGPDAEGFFSDENVVLGHRRLSILETSSIANQPMLSDDEKIILVFNGEIYNFREIRNELNIKYNFKTNNSDTETIIYAYKEWGIECIEKFNGFFAITIYDKVKQEVFIVRDRLGKKPLYYFRNNNDIYFSSEIHAFFKANLLMKELNEEAVYHYLTFLTVNAPKTFFKNILKLESGHYLKIRKNSFEIIKYWDVANYINSNIEDSYEDAVLKSEDKLSKSMHYRNIADVSISAALSGGIDSSLNLYYSSKINKNLKALNLAYEMTSKYDESQIAKKISDEMGVEFVGRVINDEDFETLTNDYLESQVDLPVGDINSILMYQLSLISKKNNCKVMLVGEGGDELGGYPVYRSIFREYKILNTVKKVRFILNFCPKKIKSKFDVFYNSQIISRRHIHGFKEFEKKEFWLGDKTFNSYKVIADYMNEIRNDLNDSFLRKILNVEYKLRLPELILARVDYPSMAVGIEARSPFMDHEIIEYTAGLSFGIKMLHGPKSIIREIASRKLPKYVLTHPKVGFGMLLVPFLEKTMPVWYENELLRNDNKLHTLISKDYLNMLLINHKKNKKQGYKMWVLYSLSKWIKVNFES